MPEWNVVEIELEFQTIEYPSAFWAATYL